MKRFVLSTLFLIAPVAGGATWLGCSDDETRPTPAGPVQDASAQTDAGPTPDGGSDGDVVPAGVLALASVLGADQEVPSSTSTTAGGTATVNVNAARTEIEVNVTLTGMTGGEAGTIVAGHIHLGKVGVNGPVMFPIASNVATDATGGAIINAKLTAENLAAGVPGAATFADAVQAIATGNAYLNFHTAANPDGEVRGQIGTVRLSSVLSGRQEAPTPVNSTLTGTGTVELNALQNEIVVTIDVKGFAAGADAGLLNAHVHIAPVGVAGGILFPLVTAGTALTSPLTRTLREADLNRDINISFKQAVDAILAGRTYLNVHTAAFPQGEIRGQVGRATVRATMSPANEVPPPSGATAAGTGTVTIDGMQEGVTAKVALSPLSSAFQGMHVHLGGPTETGPILISFMNPTVTQADGGVTLSGPGMREAAADAGLPGMAGAVDAILSTRSTTDSRTYLNVHTAAHPAGETRGQLAP